VLNSFSVGCCNDGRKTFHHPYGNLKGFLIIAQSSYRVEVATEPNRQKGSSTIITVSAENTTEIEEIPVEVGDRFGTIRFYLYLFTMMFILFRFHNARLPTAQRYEDRNH
jgi:hypothetical protein